MNDVPRLLMNDGFSIPQFGLGVWRMPREQTVASVATALEAGYRHIDTAALYDNEREVGEAVRASGVPREDVFVTTKVWNDRQRDVAAAFHESFDKLDLDYVDLYLIHWPVPSQDAYVDAWRELVKLRESGRVRSIGVSNFNADHLQRVVDATGVVPAINQVEIHPTFAQRQLVESNERAGVLTEAWRPLGAGADLDNDTVRRVAEETGRTPAQVVLRWLVQRGIIVFPKSATPSRIRSNIDVFDFSLDATQVAAMDALDRGNRLGLDPATM